MAKQKTPLNRTPERPRLRLEYRDLGEIVRWPRNPKKHDVGAINASTTRFGFRDPIAVNDETHELEVGHGRLDSLQASKAAGQPAPAFIDVDENGRWLVPVLVFQDSRAIQEAYAIAHNRTMELGGGWETEQLAAILADLAAQDGLAGVGYDGDDLDAMLRSLTDDGGAAILPSAEQAEADKQAVAAATRTLAERFGVPPFSVLDQRQGYWQERKRAWLALGIRSEVGRLQNALGLSEKAILSTQLGPAGRHYSDAKRIVAKMKGQTPQMGGVPDNPEAKIPGYYKKLEAGQTREIISEWMRKQQRKSAAYDAGNVEDAETGVFSKAHNDIAWLRAHGLGNVPNFTGTSIFDPVLCELVYRWFSPEGAEILDPFAGGSVRGVVAGRLGRSYFGVDLRQVQVDANVEQRERICPEADVQWVTGDARDLQKLLPKKRKFDLVFTCPPYFDLEQYSEDPKDLSAAKDYASFHGALEEIMANAVARLRENRFVVLVLGEIRNKRTGYYRGLIGDAERMMEKLGCHFYNEAVLVAPVGSLPVRAGRQFAGLRKLGKCHQNVLVFYKGESVEAIREMGPTEWGQIETNPEVTEEPVSDEAFVEGEE